MKLPIGAITPFRAGFALGGAAMAGFLLWLFGLPPLDGIIWVLCLLAITGAGLLGAGLALAGVHVRRAPGVLVGALTLLLPLTFLVFWSFHHEKETVPAMLARADSVRGVVYGRNAFGNLLVFYQREGHGGRLVADKKQAHAGLVAGDSLELYFAREERPLGGGISIHPLLDVWPPGPDLRQTLWRALWLWLIGGAILGGYVPRLSGRLGRLVLRPFRSGATVDH